MCSKLQSSTVFDKESYTCLLSVLACSEQWVPCCGGNTRLVWEKNKRGYYLMFAGSCNFKLNHIILTYFILLMYLSFFMSCIDGPVFQSSTLERRAPVQSQTHPQQHPSARAAHQEVDKDMMEILIWHPLALSNEWMGGNEEVVPGIHSDTFPIPPVDINVLGAC